MWCSLKKNTENLNGGENGRKKDESSNSYIFGLSHLPTLEAYQHREIMNLNINLKNLFHSNEIQTFFNGDFSSSFCFVYLIFFRLQIFLLSARRCSNIPLPLFRLLPQNVRLRFTSLPSIGNISFVPRTCYVQHCICAMKNLIYRVKLLLIFSCLIQFHRSFSYHLYCLETMLKGKEQGKSFLDIFLYFIFRIVFFRFEVSFHGWYIILVTIFGINPLFKAFAQNKST